MPMRRRTGERGRTAKLFGRPTLVALATRRRNSPTERLRPTSRRWCQRLANQPWPPPTAACRLVAAAAAAGAQGGRRREGPPRAALRAGWQPRTLTRPSWPSAAHLAPRGGTSPTLDEAARRAGGDGEWRLPAVALAGCDPKHGRVRRRVAGPGGGDWR